ncbi:hypothetical protein M5K25_019325 [Dendrobium thyrsiflorum]|uniref:Uncharacterized protein n=1 Tax=Dendrobium thyrsiflorum TaxID=117978 RepID=A0ABD0ULT4_DENTH
MAIELRKASSPAGVSVIVILLLLLFLCTTASSAETVMETYIDGYSKSSFGQNIYLSEWGLESSEHGRRLLQTNNYLGYHVLYPNRPDPGSHKPGGAYKPGCQASYYCRLGH